MIQTSVTTAAVEAMYAKADKIITVGRLPEPKQKQIKQAEIKVSASKFGWRRELLLSMNEADLKKLDINELAELLECSTSTAYSYCKRYKIKIKGKKPAGELFNEFLAFRGKPNYTPKELAKILNCSESTIFKFAKRIKVTLLRNNTKMRTIMESSARGRMFVELKDGKLKAMDTSYKEIELTEAEQAQLKAILTNKIQPA